MVFSLKRLHIILVLALVVSLSANGYFISLIFKWQQAWLEQALTTSEIEILLKKSGADITYEGITTLLENENYEFKVVSVTEEERMWLPENHKAILVNGTKLIFSDGEYAGSSANLPREIKHWGQSGF